MQSQTKPKPSEYPVALITEPKDSGYIFVLANYGYGYPGCVRVDHSTKEPGIFAADLTKEYRSPHPFVVVFARYLPDHTINTKHVVLRQFRRFLVNPGGIYHAMPLHTATEILDRVVTFEIEKKDR